MPRSNQSQKYFTSQLLNWHATVNERSLPWKSEKDPYKIWLSEVILQQTRALQGLPYYLRFTESYPTINDLANANEDEVFRLWQGLGYYNRCKNMLATAKLVVEKHNGRVPDSYEGLLELKGIGPYTASAIASFAFGRPNAVVDGNVYRVLSRYFGIDTPIDTTEGKTEFASLARDLLDKKNSAAYNQAIMDLGATVCTPSGPKCEDCPLAKRCVAFAKELTGLLPVKSKKLKIKTRYFNYIIFVWNNSIWLHKRSAKDIWENLNEPWLIETEQPIDEKEVANESVFVKNKISLETIKYSGTSSQRLTHRIIEARFYTVALKKKPQFPDDKGKWVAMSALSQTPFPKTVLSFLEKNLYF